LPAFFLQFAASDGLHQARSGPFSPEKVRYPWSIVHLQEISVGDQRGPSISCSNTYRSLGVCEAWVALRTSLPQRLDQTHLGHMQGSCCRYSQPLLYTQRPRPLGRILRRRLAAVSSPQPCQSAPSLSTEAFASLSTYRTACRDAPPGSLCASVTEVHNCGQCWAKVYLPGR